MLRPKSDEIREREMGALKNYLLAIFNKVTQ